MAKFLIACTGILLLATLTNAQFGWGPFAWGGGGFGPAMGGPPAFIKPPQLGIQQVIEQIQKANLPADMQEQSDQVLLDAAEGFKSCDDSFQTNPIYWQYKLCNVMQYRKAAMAVKALENEAAARTTVAPVAA